MSTYTAHTLVSGGVTRNYKKFLPTTLANPAPLVMAWHGLSSTPDQMKDLCDYNTKAEVDGTIVVYPEATGFNSAWQIGYQSADVVFAGDLITELQSAHTINANRVYSSGMSQGTHFSYRLASDLGNRIAAIGVRSGSMTYGEWYPTHKVPIKHRHGDADSVVNIDGSSFFYAAQWSIDFWVAWGSDATLVLLAGEDHGWGGQATTDDLWAFMLGKTGPAALITAVKTYYRPTSDVTLGLWTSTPASPATAWDKLDETGGMTGSGDADNIKSSQNPDNDAAEVKFASVTNPGAQGNVFLHFRQGKDTTGGKGIRVTAQLRQGGVVLKAWAIPDMDEKKSAFYGLPASVVSLITDWSDLRIRLIAHVTNSLGTSRRITWRAAELLTTTGSLLELSGTIAMALGLSGNLTQTQELSGTIAMALNLSGALDPIVSLSGHLDGELSAVPVFSSRLGAAGVYGSELSVLPVQAGQLGAGGDL